MARPRAATDDEILDAVVRVVGRHGPAGLTLARVGEAVGLTAPAVAGRFGSRHGLLVAVAARGVRHLDAAVREARRRPAPHVPVLVDLLAAQVDGIGSPVELGNHVAFLHLDLVDPVLRRHLRARTRLLRRGIGSLLAAAAARGELTGVDVERLAEVVHAAYHGSLVTWAATGSGDLAGSVRRHIGCVLDPYLASPVDRCVSPRAVPGDRPR